jgi:hypothetical protein
MNGRALACRAQARTEARIRGDGGPPPPGASEFRATRQVATSRGEAWRRGRRCAGGRRPRGAPAFLPRLRSPSSRREGEPRGGSFPIGRGRPPALRSGAPTRLPRARNRPAPPGRLARSRPERCDPARPRGYHGVRRHPGPARDGIPPRVHSCFPDEARPRFRGWNPLQEPDGGMYGPRQAAGESGTPVFSFRTSMAKIRRLLEPRPPGSTDLTS